MTKLFMLLCFMIFLFDSYIKAGLIYRPKRSEFENVLGLDNVRNEEGVADTNGDLPYCFETEPCQFVFVKKNPRDPKNPMKKTVPSWCQCSNFESCIQTAYDRRRKMEIYRCQPEGQEQQQKSTPERRRRHHHNRNDNTVLEELFHLTLTR